MSDSSAWTPRITVSSPDEVPLLVPHLLGFEPGRSLVVVGLAPGHDVVLTLRFDLPPDQSDDRAERLSHWHRAVSAVAAAGASSAVVAVYPDEEGAAWTPRVDLPHAAAAHDIATLLELCGLTVGDELCVAGGRMRSYLCSDEGCCPVEGREPDPAERLRVESLFVVHGSAPLRSRAALEASLASRPADDAFVAAVRAARDGVFVRQPAGVVERVEGFVRDVARWGEHPGSTSMITRLVVVAGLLVADIPSRDLLLQRLTGRPRRELLVAARQVLVETVRCSQGQDAAQPAATLAVCAWAAGDGAAARVAVERALDADPGCSLAQLVGSALDSAMPPSTWTAAMRALTDEEILGAGPPGQERSPA